MSKNILVAYATKCGSTIEVAQAIGETLALNGTSVDIKPIKDIAEINGYDAFVIGSAIRMAQWLPEAKEFVQKYQTQLSKLPTAIFSVHILNQGDGPDANKERLAYTAPVRDLLAPISEAFFPGKIEQSQLAFTERLLFKMVKSPEGDFRDWNLVRGWGDKLKSQI